MLKARRGVGKAFIVAFRSGAVMGFLLAANGLLVLYITINLFSLYYGTEWEGLFEATIATAAIITTAIIIVAAATAAIR